MISNFSLAIIYVIIGTFPGGSFGFCPFQLTELSHGNLAIVCTNESEISIIDTHNQQPIRTQALSSPTNHGMCMAMCTVNEHCILIGCEDGHMLLYDHRNLAVVDSLNCHEESIMALDYSKSLKRGYTGSVGVTLKTCKFHDNKLQHYKETEVTNEGFNFIKVRADDKLLATCGWDSNIRLFGCKQLKHLAVLQYHKSAVQTLTFGPDQTLYAGSKDGHISSWKIY